MLIYIGADHQGFKLKDALKKFLKERGYEIIDVGNDKYDENDDYPDFAALVARQVAQDIFTRKGVLICGSGAGVGATRAGSMTDGAIGGGGLANECGIFGCLELRYPR